VSALLCACRLQWGQARLTYLYIIILLCVGRRHMPLFLYIISYTRSITKLLPCLYYYVIILYSVILYILLLLYNIMMVIFTSTQLDNIIMDGITIIIITNEYVYTIYYNNERRVVVILYYSSTRVILNYVWKTVLYILSSLLSGHLNIILRSIAAIWGVHIDSTDFLYRLRRLLFIIYTIYYIILTG